MNNPFTFQRAVREQVKLKVLVTGASGSGKTLGTLRLAESLCPGRIAVIDSENARSSYYADAVEFDVLTISDHKPDTYIAAMRAAVEAGYTAVIVDSLSHAWQNVLDRKAAYDKANPRSNSYTNWKAFSAEWDKLVREILELPAHVFATARSKQDYEQAEVDGKKKVIKLGLAPTIREGTEYEFVLHFDLNEQHKVDIKKDNTRRFGDDSKLWDLCDGSIAHELREWLAGATPVARPTPETAAAIDDAIAALPEKKQAEARRRWAIRRDQGVTEEDAQAMLAKLLPTASDDELEAAKRKAESERAEAEGWSGAAQAKQNAEPLPSTAAEQKAELEKRAARRLQAPANHPDAKPEHAVAHEAALAKDGERGAAGDDETALEAAHAAASNEPVRDFDELAL